MNSNERLHYNHVHSGGTAYYQQPRCVIEVKGGEAIQFLDGLITNDVKTLEDGAQMRAALPDANGRLIAVVRVLRNGERFLIETEDATRKKVFDNLFRFTMAGDFLVEDLSDAYRFVSVFDRKFIPITPPFIEFDMKYGTDYFVHEEDESDFLGELKYLEAAEISASLFDVLRVEHGIPRYGVDMDATTVVPEIGLDDLISYNKGCYIGQEIIARIHFRGHVAKKLTGIVAAGGTDLTPDAEITSVDGKSAGRVTSTVRSPKLNRAIGLAYVRYEFLKPGTHLIASETTVEVTKLPFV